MTKEVVELNCGLSDLEIDHEEGTVSFVCGEIIHIKILAFNKLGS